MPFRSEAQRRFLWARHPDIAEAWAHGEHTSSGPHRMPSRNSKRKGVRSLARKGHRKGRHGGRKGRK